MKTKILLAVALSACSASTLLHAGGMGPVKKPTPFFIPFLAGEGMYTWPQVDGYNITLANASVGGQVQNLLMTSNKVNDGWGGRLAGGFLHPMKGRFEAFSGSLEAGWGYYGSMNLDPVVHLARGATVSVPSVDAGRAMRQYGVDLLAGLVYDQPKYDLFFKVGALVQNLQTKINANPAGLEAISGNRGGRVATTLTGEYIAHQTMVNVLPMLRLGGGYRVKENWLITASWMHAFGSTLKVTLPALDFTDNSFGGIKLQLASPSLDAAMLGLEYRFAS